MDRKCLFISPKRETAGGKLVMDRNLDFCRKYFGHENVYYIENFENLGKIRQYFSMLFGDFYPINDLKKKVNLHIKSGNIKYIFVDLSLCGNFIKYIKTNYPNIIVLCYFHNVEYTYFNALYNSQVKHYKNIILKAVLNTEKKSVRYSDVIISMNQRDSNDLDQHYGRYADFLLPTSLEDSFSDSQSEIKTTEEPLNLLFVGSAFFANTEAVNWFIEKVVPFIKIKFVFTVVGKGFENIQYITLPSNVRIIGKVDDLAPYYKEADYIVSPIFSGSGMKTKTAEALMFGKSILGTDEAFEGFELDFKQVGARLNTDKEYINFLNQEVPLIQKKINKYSRNIFLKKYFNDNLYHNFKKNMDKLLK